jgi:hypothetical protein
MTAASDTVDRSTLRLPAHCGCRADFTNRIGSVVTQCALHAAADELLQALTIFGAHHRLCYRVAHGKHSMPDDCDCGLDAALRNAGGKAT